MKLVISLGGSAIVPDKVDINFLKKFRKVIDKIKKGNKIVIVTGGGSTARKYIEALREEGVNYKLQSKMGVSVCKLNAMLVSGIFGKGIDIPENVNELNNSLKKGNIVVTGPVSFNPEGTSDWTAALIANIIKADIFVNITNVKGLYDKDPKKYKNAKFISEISFKDFSTMINKIKFKPGQHFVLDQNAAKIIGRNKIKTVIIKNINNLVRVVKNEKVTGTVIG